MIHKSSGLCFVCPTWPFFFSPHKVGGCQTGFFLAGVVEITIFPVFFFVFFRVFFSFGFRERRDDMNQNSVHYVVSIFLVLLVENHDL